MLHYTIPSDNRELQLNGVQLASSGYYTIPSDNRELQQKRRLALNWKIIPYQVITGNYNNQYNDFPTIIIIPYQVITGNYNIVTFEPFFFVLYHTK